MAVITLTFAIITILFGILRFPITIRIIPAQLWSYLARFGMVSLLWLRIKIANKHNISTIPCVYICKHQSSWETVVLYSLMPKICFVLKQELLIIPFFGQALKVVSSIPIDRTKSLKAFKQVLQNGKTCLMEGLSIVVFPEGTRVPQGYYPKFHRTAITLAKSTGASVVPVAHNSGIFWPNRIGLIKPGCVTICFGDMVSSDEFTIDELNQYCYDWMNDQVKKTGG